MVAAASTSATRARGISASVSATIGAQLRRLEVREQEDEVEREVQLVEAVAVEAHEALEVEHARLAEQTRGGS